MQFDTDCLCSQLMHHNYIDAILVNLMSLVLCADFALGHCSKEAQQTRS